MSLMHVTITSVSAPKPSEYFDYIIKREVVNTPARKALTVTG